MGYSSVINKTMLDPGGHCRGSGTVSCLSFTSHQIKPIQQLCGIVSVNENLGLEIDFLRNCVGTADKATYEALRSGHNLILHCHGAQKTLVS